MGLFSKDIQTMDDLLLHGLQDIYYAENQIIKALPKIQLLPLIGQVRAGNHLNHPAVRMLKIRKFKMQTIPPQPLNIDGDVKGLTPAVIEVIPNTLKVMVR